MNYQVLEIKPRCQCILKESEINSQVSMYSKRGRDQFPGPNVF